MDLFILFLCITLLFYGVTVFIGERVLLVIAGIAALIAAFIGFARLI